VFTRGPSRDPDHDPPDAISDVQTTRRIAPADRLLSDELIKDRRRKAARRTVSRVVLDASALLSLSPRTPPG